MIDTLSLTDAFADNKTSPDELRFGMIVSIDKDKTKCLIVKQDNKSYPILLVSLSTWEHYDEFEDLKSLCDAVSEILIIGKLEL